MNYHLRLGPGQYDELYARARRDRVTVPEFIRRALDRAEAEDRDRREG